MDIKVLNQEKDEPEKTIDMMNYIEKNENQEQWPTEHPEADTTDKAQELVDELEDMKQQLKALQAEIDRQTTLREEDFKKLMNSRTNSFKNREFASIILVAIVAFGMPPVLYYCQHHSIWFCLFTFLFFLFGLGWEIKIWKQFHLSNMMELDLLTTAKNMQQYRKLNRIWLNQIGLPFVFVWASWYLYELIGQMELPEDGSTKWIIIGTFAACIIVGGIIGGLIGYFTFYKPQMKLAQEMIEQIEELEKD